MLFVYHVLLSLRPTSRVPTFLSPTSPRPRVPESHVPRSCPTFSHSPWFSHAAARPMWDMGQRCGIFEHLSPTHNLSQALIADWPAKLNSAQLRRKASDQCLEEVVSAINVHIMMSQAGGYVPGRSTAYANQASLDTASMKSRIFINFV